jgi:hypothetical protein
MTRPTRAASGTPTPRSNGGWQAGREALAVLTWGCRTLVVFKGAGFESGLAPQFSCAHRRLTKLQNPRQLLPIPRLPRLTFE